MPENLLLSVWLVLVWLLIWYLLAKIFFLLKIKRMRSDSVKQSRHVVMGQVTEQLAPLLPDFPYHYKDAMFLGKGVDYVIFDGLHRGKLDNIVFLEVKSGVAQLNNNEKMIKNALISGKIRYDVWRI
jgi:predicted Holliday junction resolvase-like endonuclease